MPPKKIKLSDLATELQLTSEVLVQKISEAGIKLSARVKTLSEEEAQTLRQFVQKKGVSLTEVRKGDIVLVLTGFYKKFGQAEYYEKYPEITEDFAKKLVDLGVKIVGVDTPSPDRPPFNIHKLLLKNDVLIIENLTNLEKLLGIKKFEIFAFPPNFDVEGSPVRVVAKVN